MEHGKTHHETSCTSAECEFKEINQVILEPSFAESVNVHTDKKGERWLFRIYTIAAMDK
jgi:hypothetical protein